MDVETELSFPRMPSRNGFSCAKRPRTEVDQHDNPANSRDGFHEQHSSENGMFFKTPDQRGNYFNSASLGYSRRFLTIHASGLVYESEEFRPKGETLYTPLQEDVIVNTRNIEQFTFTKGSFFIGDVSSRFCRTVQGIFLASDSEHHAPLLLWGYGIFNQKIIEKRIFLGGGLKDTEY